MRDTGRLPPEHSLSLFRVERDLNAHHSKSAPLPLLTLPFIRAPHHQGATSAPSPSCPRETAPKPFHNTKQMARRTDGPFTQASRNRQGPARTRARGQMELRPGGPRSPGPRHQAWEERRQTPGARNLTNKRLVPTTREGATVKTGMTETHRDDEEGRAVNDTRQKAPAPRPGTEGQGPPTLRNPTGWHHVSRLGADWHWSQERGKEEQDAESFLQDDGEDAGTLALRFPGGAGQPGQAAGQQTHASLQCEALKLWHLCRARCQAPGRTPRTTFCKSLVNTKGGRSRRQEREGRNEVALRGTSLS